MENLSFLIREKKFSEVLNLNKKNFFSAYAHYRLFNFKKSLKILHNLRKTKRIKILMAQNYFYLGEFKKAYDIFREFSDDSYVQFNMNCLVYFSRNILNLPEKYSIYPKDNLTEPIFKFSNIALAEEDLFNSSFQYLNSKMEYYNYLELHSSNTYIKNQLGNLNRDGEMINKKFLLPNQKLIFKKNCGEKILIKNRRLFQNNYTFRKFSSLKNILKLNKMDFILGTFLDLKNGREHSKNLKYLNGKYEKIFTILFNNEEEQYRKIYEIITNL